MWFEITFFIAAIPIHVKKLNYFFTQEGIVYILFILSLSFYYQLTTYNLKQTTNNQHQTTYQNVV
jgi:hypothetical protein